MSINETQVKEFATAIEQLYAKILLSNIPIDAAYLSYLDRDTPFGLAGNAYRDSYNGLLRRVFQLPHIRDMWSEDGIQELGHDLLIDLAEAKRAGGGPPDFQSIARQWLTKVEIPFQEQVCYAGVVGLSVADRLEIGDVTFLPLNIKQPELEDPLAKTFCKSLDPIRDCLSSSRVTADWRRASQIHREKTERALNVLRFIGSLIWHDQPTRHVYVASEYPKRISNTIVVAPGGEVSRVGASDFAPLPLQIDEETIKYACFYGLDEIQAMLTAAKKTEMQKAFLTAIQWYGQATQELLPLVAFVKYYISIEVALKSPSERAWKVLPRRLGVLLEPWDKSRFSALKHDLKQLISERNAVFHSGVPLSSRPEELQWNSRILSRQALHQLRLRLKSENWQSKGELAYWVKHQFERYLK